MSLAPVDRARIVAAGVERDAQAALGRERTVAATSSGRLRVDDGDGALVDRQVPGLSGGVPPVVVWEDDVAGQMVVEFAELHGR